MRAILLALVLSVVMTRGAPAQTLSQAWAWCRDHDPDLLIRGCSAIIRSGKETMPMLARAFFDRGRAWADRGEYARAIEDFDHAIKLDPNYPDAFNGRALARRGLGQDDQALEDFNEAIRQDPNYAIALYNRGLTFRAMGRLDEAAKDFASAREAGPRLTEPKE